MPNPASKHDAFAALKIRDYRLFVGFRFFMTIAIQMQSLIIGWQVYELTRDPLSLGLVGLAEAVPFIAVALYAGHIADLHDRKRIILYFEMMFLAGTLILFLFSLDLARFHRAYGLLPIYLVVGLTGIARTFIAPAQTALSAQIVPRELFPNASTWNSTTWHVSAITGPALGGLIYGFFGVKIAYGAILSFGILSIALLGAVPRRPVPASLVMEPLKRRLLTGLRFVFGHQILLASMSLDMFGVLFGGAVSMLPVFAAEVLRVGPQGLGFLRAAPMAGAVLMSVFLAYRPPMRKTGRFLLLGVSGFGMSIILFALSKNYYLSLALLFLSGLFDNISVIIRATTLQLVTPDEMRGRVASVNSIFIGSSNEIGSFESGVAARLMGLVPSVVFGGAMTLLVVGATAKLAPALRRLSLKSLG
jgi:MFS family permease